MDIVKKEGNRDERFRYLATHMVDKAIEKDALIVSEIGRGLPFFLRPARVMIIYGKTYGPS